MTKTDSRKRIPIPSDIKPGDVLVLRDGQRKRWCGWNGDGLSVCEGIAPGWHNKDGSWSRTPGWDVVAVERKGKPKPVRDDKDAVWLMHLINYPEFTVSKSRTSRLRAIARRLNGGKAVGT